MKNRLGVIMVLMGLSFALMPGFVVAGIEEGLAAYAKGDYATALKEFKPLAADQGDFNVQGLLGAMYAEGLGVPQDYKEAVKWFRLAAEQGYALAQNYLGLMYDKGQGVSQDYKEAVKWYHLAAGQGNAYAQSNLGLMYYDGHGVPQDYKESVRWSRLAAEQGYVSAQHNLGLMYVKGQGVPQDYKEAVKWFRLAAEQGYGDAQSNLGLMYARGQGVHGSKVIAYALYNVSAANDPSDEKTASMNRTKIAASMSQKEIEEGQALCREVTKPGNLLKALDAYVAKKGSKPTPQKKKKK